MINALVYSMKRGLSRKSSAKEMMRHCNFVVRHALFGAHLDLSETAHKKERKLMIEKSNEDPESDGG